MPAFGGQILATAVIYGWLWNRTASLPAVIAIHAAANTATGLVPVLPAAAGSTAPMWMTVALAVGVAAVLIVATGGDLGAERHSISAGHSARS